jgi:hypothetical protein
MVKGHTHLPQVAKFLCFHAICKFPKVWDAEMYRNARKDT